MKRRLFSNKGFSLVGMLVAASIGAVVAAGVAQLGVNIQSYLRNAQSLYNLMNLKDDINFTFKQPGSCTKSLVGFEGRAGAPAAWFEIKDGVTGDTKFKSGGIHKKIYIHQIRFFPGPPPYKTGKVVIHFSLSDDKRETLKLAESLKFDVKGIKYESGTDKIESCEIEGGAKYIPPLRDDECGPENRYIYGFDSNGGFKCKPIKGLCSGVNKFVRGFDSDGKVVCETIAINGGCG